MSGMRITRGAHSDEIPIRAVPTRHESSPPVNGALIVHDNDVSAPHMDLFHQRFVRQNSTNFVQQTRRARGQTRHLPQIQSAPKPGFDIRQKQPANMRRGATAKKIRRAFAGYLEGFQATVTAVKANEAILGRKRVELKREWYELS